MATQRQDEVEKALDLSERVERALGILWLIQDEIDFMRHPDADSRRYHQRLATEFVADIHMLLTEIRHGKWCS